MRSLKSLNLITSFPADNQLIIVRYDGLPALKKVLVGSSGEMLTAVAACVRNLSVHKANEVRIL
jgi:hypothetical protein